MRFAPVLLLLLCVFTSCTMLPHAAARVPVVAATLADRMEYFYQDPDQERSFREIIDVFAGQPEPPKEYVARVYGFVSAYCQEHEEGYDYYLSVRGRFRSAVWVRLLDELHDGVTTTLAAAVKDRRYDQSPLACVWASYFVYGDDATLGSILDFYGKLEFPSEEARYYAKELRFFVDRHPIVRQRVEGLDAPFARWVLEQAPGRLEADAQGLDQLYRLEQYLDE